MHKSVVERYWPATNRESLRLFAANFPHYELSETEAAQECKLTRIELKRNSDSYNRICVTVKGRTRELVCFVGSRRIPKAWWKLYRIDEAFISGYEEEQFPEDEGILCVAPLCL